ncbi:hypothetical protein Sjap_020201 [Stephania japonica]|uniref:Uncharacterized protein n=1 Tax=Stephania japonica TaxID=461633 RepID=A0AAP0F5R8_9MAGN
MFDSSPFGARFILVQLLPVQKQSCVTFELRHGWDPVMVLALEPETTIAAALRRVQCVTLGTSDGWIILGLSTPKKDQHKLIQQIIAIHHSGALGRRTKDACEAAVAGGGASEPTTLHHRRSDHDDGSGAARRIHDVPQQARPFFLILRQAYVGIKDSSESGIPYTCKSRCDCECYLLQLNWGSP